MTVWSPYVGEELVVTPEPSNIVYQYAVAITKDGQVVGHFPRNYSYPVFCFLQREENRCRCKVTGKRINRGGGLGLEIPCMYTFTGCKNYITRLKELLDTKQSGI